MLSLSQMTSTHPASSAPADPAFLSERVTAYYRERVEATWGGGHIMKGRQPGPGAVMLVSNDYLSLSGHPAIVDAQVAALETEGHGMLRSDVFRMGRTPLRLFEERVAGLMEAEDAVVCQSGWCANVGLVQSIAGPATPVYVDMFAHMSLWEGVLSAGATPRPFKHNDPESLERMVQKHGPGVVVVDAIYSTSGTECALAEIVAVGERHGCVLVVDESHALGTHGKTGAGLTVALGLSERVHFRTSSLSKAFAARGGLVVGSARNMEYFRYESRPAIFSSGMLPHEAAGFLATLELIEQGQERRRRLHGNADHVRSRLSALGYNVDASDSQIISLVAGPEPQTLVLRDALESCGVFGSVFCAPATAKNRSLVRFSINAGLEKEQLDRIVSVCAAIRHEVDMHAWASTRRRALPAAG